MKIISLSIPIALTLALAGCASTSNGSPGAPPGNEQPGGPAAASSRTPCPDVMLAPPENPDPSRPWAPVPADSALPAGFEFVSELHPSCLQSFTLDGVVHYSASFLDATEGEAQDAYHAAEKLAATRGWEPTTQDADALGDDFIEGEWIADTNLNAEEVWLQAFLPMPREYATAYGVDGELNLLGIEIAVKK
jgi:hypothetical protein